jgi:hypothetical protein
VRKLAEEHPAKLIVFDLLVSPDGRSCFDLPLRAAYFRAETAAKKQSAAS